MYLETIYLLHKKTGHVHSVDISEHMGYSKPSVSRAVGLLKKGEYITVSSQGFLSLTDKGLKVAEKIVERHMLLTKVLTAFGVDDKTAAEDACRIEHVISDESFAAIKKFITENNVQGQVENA